MLCYSVILNLWFAWKSENVTAPLHFKMKKKGNKKCKMTTELVPFLYCNNIPFRPIIRGRDYLRLAFPKSITIVSMTAGMLLVAGIYIGNSFPIHKQEAERTLRS